MQGRHKTLICKNSICEAHWNEVSGALKSINQAELTEVSAHTCTELPRLAATSTPRSGPVPN